MILLSFSNIVYAQQKLYRNIFEITRSNNTDFTNFVIIAPCPQSCEYQNIDNLSIDKNGEWGLCNLSENKNKILGLYLDEKALRDYLPDFVVGFSFIHTPKCINIDFSNFRNPDGTWKDLPDYDTTDEEYINNCKSNEFVNPDNPIIQLIADSLFHESNMNRLIYAERCYNHVASNYQYLNPNTGLHKLNDILIAGGGDCGNLSSIYISLLRAKGIPARHVIAIGDKGVFHAWAEFYIQNFGWIPVDVSYKNANREGDYFGRYNYNMVVVQKGVSQDYPVPLIGISTIDLLQTFRYWYWYNSPAEISIKQRFISEDI